MADKDTRILGGPQAFPQTSWSMIQQARDAGSTSHRESLERLCRKYWPPVYFFVRRNWVKDVEEAKDLTQAFFTAFLEKDFLGSFESERGRFRNFVCVALRHFLSKEKRASRAKKRRPREGLVSLEVLGDEDSQFDVPAQADQDPERQFQADWKRAVIEAALAALRERAAAAGKSVCVELLMRYDIERPEGTKLTYEDLAAHSGLTVFQVTNGLHWARKELKGLLLAEIKDQVSTEDELRAEAWELFSIRV